MKVQVTFDVQHAQSADHAQEVVTTFLKRKGVGPAGKVDLTPTWDEEQQKWVPRHEYQWGYEDISTC